MEAISRATLAEFNALAGKTVNAHFQDIGYWHLVVELRCTDGQSIVFNTEDVGVGKYFEVFPIKIGFQPTAQRAWTPWAKEKTIQEVIPLFREEWLAPSSPHPQLVGSAPHHIHHAGRGPASKEAVQHTVVQAGVMLRFNPTESLVVYAASAAPFNVEVALTQTEVERALEAFSAPEA